MNISNKKIILFMLSLSCTIFLNSAQLNEEIGKPTFPTPLLPLIFMLSKTTEALESSPAQAALAGYTLGLATGIVPLLLPFTAVCTGAATMQLLDKYASVATKTNTPFFPERASIRNINRTSSMV